MFMKLMSKIRFGEKATRKEDLKKTAALLSQKKSSLLEELRSGKIGLPKVLENHVTDACRDEKNPFYAFVKEIFHESTH
ncbi:hypothetical protein LSH36_406g02024 [Paralvinella palmiformis]|uniref:Uncharacterized protein n=1 Tax=Paralvinella palmiformis TaxID=53620 RepID=A0AAD9JC16_9ANNE|nr:hypothetical protein LSH36_406g02024 [Paralvinella palmiformis]